MSESIPEYILRPKVSQEIVVRNGQRSLLLKADFGNDITDEWFWPIEKSAWFMPLDKQALTEQLENELNEYIYMMVSESVQHSLEEKEWAEGMMEHSKKVIAKIVLDALFGLENKESSDDR